MDLVKIFVKVVGSFFGLAGFFYNQGAKVRAYQRKHEKNIRAKRKSRERRKSVAEEIWILRAIGNGNKR